MSMFKRETLAVEEPLLAERNREKENATIWLFDELFRDYDQRIRPYFATGRPIEIDVSLGIVSFEGISETHLDFTINAYLIQCWTDPRLRYNASFILPPTSYYANRVWLPDLIFMNAKLAELHRVTLVNRVVEINPDGTVCLTQRLRLTLACGMDFTHFPTDEQRCPIDMESFEYNSRFLHIKFSKEAPVFVFGGHSKIPHFTLRGAILGNCDKKLAFGSISCIRVEFLFQRQIGYYILHAYIPSLTLVALSWVSFWIDIRSAPARVSLGITTILSMLTISNGVKMDLPRVAYVKAIDIWFVVSYIYVIGALLEYAVVHYLAVQSTHLVTTEREKKEVSERNDTKDGLILYKKPTFNINNYSMFHRKEETSSPKPELWASSDKNLSNYKYVKGQKIDKISRLCFPFSFIIFLALYSYISTPHLAVPDMTIQQLEDAVKLLRIGS
ncbi:putative glycine receptor subunit alpha-2-like [Apostichopus japonicus]|uniref:Putative glycine receptor subunit alpha-2-like n=1 Tax=Stichopus japonicus TaxID=307972 RepID=A0A2G8L2D2_STIJA|nr:putative glycine receptor subunit alpha-2-like [Apostichopus japonicus]